MPAYPSASRKWVKKVSLDTCPFILGYIAKYPWILDEVTLLAFSLISLDFPVLHQLKLLSVR